MTEKKREQKEQTEEVSTEQLLQEKESIWKISYRFLQKNKKTLSWISLLVSLIWVTVTFLLKRLPFYLYSPVVLFRADSGSYYEVMKQLGGNGLPRFEIRPPGYPLFIKVVTSLHDSIIAVSCYQTILAFISTLLLVYAIHRIFPAVTLIFSFFLTVFVNGLIFFQYETTYLTESLFVSSTFVFIAFSFLALNKPEKRRYWILLSISTFLAIMIKPASMFLLPFFVLFVLFLWFRKSSLKIYLSLLAPIVSLLFLFSAYNYVSAGFFKVSAFGSLNMLGATINFQKTNSNYLTSVNNAIEKFSTPSANYNTCHKFKYYLMKDSLFKQETDSLYPGVRKEIVLEQIFSEVSNDAIKNNPSIYFQRFISQFLYYYKREFSYTALNGFRRELLYRCSLKYFKEEDYNERKKGIMMELHYQKMPPLPEHITVESNQVRFNIKHQKLIRKAYSFERFMASLTSFTRKTVLMRTLLFINFIVSLILLILQLGQNPKVFALFIFNTVAILKGLLIALVETAINRYAYTMSFVEYLSFLISILLVWEIILLFRNKNFFWKRTQAVNIQGNEF